MQLLAEFDHLTNYHETIEMTVLGHFQVSSIKNFSNLLNCVHTDIRIPEHVIKEWLDAAASASKSASSGKKLYRVVYKLDSFIFVITVVSLSPFLLVCLLVCAMSTK